MADTTIDPRHAARIAEFAAINMATHVMVRQSTRLCQRASASAADIQLLVADTRRQIEEAQQACRRAGVRLWERA